MKLRYNLRFIRYSSKTPARHQKHKIYSIFAQHNSLTNEQIFIEELVNASDKSAPEISGQYVPGCNEQLPPEVGHLLGTVLQQ